MKRLLFSYVAFALLLAGCSTVTDFELPETETVTFTLPFTRGLDGFDILFVVDKTTDLDPLLEGMADQTDSLATDAMGYGGPVLELDPGSQALPLRLQLGVISSDIGAGGYDVPGCTEDGDAGAILGGQLCATSSTGWLVVEDGVVISPSGGGLLSDAIGCVVREVAQTPGCRFKQPLRSVELALQNATNSGFFRANAGLAVVLLTNDDDCSADDPSLFDPDDGSLGPLGAWRCFEQGIICTEQSREPGQHNDCRARDQGVLATAPRLAAAIRDFKRPDPVVVTAVAGPPDPVNVQVIASEPDLLPSCVSNDVSARPAIRIAAFLDELGADDGFFGSICQPDMTSLIDWLMARMASSLAYRCMSRPPADIDPNAPGLQPSCTVEDVINPGQLDENRVEMPACSDTGGVLPCWDLVETGSCTAGYRMELRRSGAPPGNSEVQVTCEVPLEE